MSDDWTKPWDALSPEFDVARTAAVRADALGHMVAMGVTVADTEMERQLVMQLTHGAVIAKAGPARLTGVRWLIYPAAEAVQTLEASGWFREVTWVNRSALLAEIAARPSGLVVLAMVQVDERIANRHAS